MNTHENVSRRSFFGAAALGASSSLLPAQAGSSSAQRKNNRRLGIGAMAVGDMSFWSYSWGDLLSPDKPVNKETIGTRLLNMDITHVWDVDYKTAERFAETVGAKAGEKI